MSATSTVVLPRGSWAGEAVAGVKYAGQQTITKIHEKWVSAVWCAALFVVAYFMQIVAGPETTGQFLFLLAAYAAMLNDGPQTTSNFIAAFPRAHWLLGTLLFVSVLVLTHYQPWIDTGGNFATGAGGDLAFGKLNKMPLPEEFTWRQILGPALLIYLSELGIQLSNTVLLQTPFATKAVFGEIMLKTAIGWTIGLGLAYVWWTILRRAGQSPPVRSFFARSHVRAVVDSKELWGALLCIFTALLFHFWVRNDTGQTVVFLVRKVPPMLALGVMAAFAVAIAINIKNKNREMETIVEGCPGLDPQADWLHRTRELVFVVFWLFICLAVMDQRMHVPMSSSFVSLGILAGRLLALIGQEPELTFRFAIRKISLDNLKPIAAMIAVAVLNYDKFL